MSSINKPIQGIGDLFGFQLRKRNHLIRSLSDFAQRFGFQQLEVPVVERASSFSEEIVGKSPWPEWDKRGCFYLKVDNYAQSYDNQVSQEDALLNPEGTISVTRWLGRVIQENGEQLFPFKLFYDVQCFRNELVDKLSKTKHRQFRQFGMEILGSSSIAADMEIACMINECLLLLGFPQESVVMRISDIRIFTQLIQESAISYDDSLMIKELMDSIAESRAGKNPELVPSLKEKFWKCLEPYNLVEGTVAKWQRILDSPQVHLSDDTKALFGDKYHEPFAELDMLIESLVKYGVTAKADLCVVRSHEYYTGISFEIDVVSDEVSFYEIAGGGRYDRLVTSFLSGAEDDTIVPSTGFAFGVERVIEAATHFGLLSKLQKVESFSHFDDVSADSLLVLSAQLNSCDAYVEAMAEVKAAPPEQRTNIYVGNNQNPVYLEEYMKFGGIPKKVQLE